MIQRKNAQRSFGDLILDPVLRRIDQLLDDETMVEAVLCAQRARKKQSARRGRPSTPAEVVLRMLALKHVRNWSYEELQREVTSNFCYRRFCRIDAGKVPDSTTMVRQGQLFNEQALRTLLDRGVAQAIENKLTRGHKMRVDTTVVEANIHHPTDSGLCEDAIHFLGRAVRGLQRAGVKIKGGFVNVSRSVSRRMREISQAVRLRGDEAKAAIKKPYRRLLRVTGQVIRRTQAAIKQAKCQVKQLPQAQRKKAESRIAKIEGMLPLAKQVVRQTRARVMRGVTDSASKIISVFEPHSQILRRGKAHKPTEFGMLAKVQEAEGGIVTDVGLVPQKADAPLLVPSVERHIEVFGKAPRLVATDRGFYSGEGERRITELGVKRPVIPKPGAKSQKRIEHEQQRWFRKGRAWRAGGEARISRLKHQFGMAKCLLRGESGMTRTVYWAAIANNLVAVGRAGE